MQQHLTFVIIVKQKYSPSRACKYNEGVVFNFFNFFTSKILIRGLCFSRNYRYICI